MLVPETGVVLVEDGKEKSGSDNFTNKFGKMSMKEFESMKAKYNSNNFQESNTFKAVSNMKEIRESSEFINNKDKNAENNKSNNKLTDMGTQNKNIKESFIEFSTTNNDFNKSRLISNNPNLNINLNNSKYKSNTFKYDYNKHNNLLKNVYTNSVTPLSSNNIYNNTNNIINNINYSNFNNQINPHNNIHVKGNISNIHDNIIYDDTIINDEKALKQNRDNLDNSLEYLYENFQDDNFILNENLFKKPTYKSKKNGTQNVFSSNTDFKYSINGIKNDSKTKVKASAFVNDFNRNLKNNKTSVYNYSNQNNLKQISDVTSNRSTSKTNILRAYNSTNNNNFGNYSNNEKKKTLPISNRQRVNKKNSYITEFEMY